MKDLKNRLTSRKFLMTIGAVVALVLMGVTGQMEWNDVMEKMSYLVLGYISIEGGNDIVKTWKK